MKVKLIFIGKTDSQPLTDLIQKYSNRLQHYLTFSVEIIPELKRTKKLSEVVQKQKEGHSILEKISEFDRLFLLDETGKTFDSIGFAGFLQKQMNSGLKQLVFAIGGPYGFSDEVYKKASGKISLSKMTFSHQMVRLFAIEQLYRGMTILKNQPYHHQ